MAVSIEDIKKLRAMTGAGLADVKKALTEAEGDFDKAKELLRERGLAIAAKRSDRETSNGCVLVKKVNDFAAIIALKCETDFVANGVLEGDNIEVYDHMNKHTLCTMVQLNENNEEAGHKVAMQVAAMRPVALDESSVSEETKKTELEVAVAKTKEELVEKAVNAALKKAGINPAHVDSEEHIESNTKKGWLTPEQAEEARNIKKTVGEEKAATLNPTMIQNIANGRLAKFFKENCLVDQEFQFGDGDKQTVAQYLASQSKDLKIVAYQRFTLAAE